MTQNPLTGTTNIDETIKNHTPDNIITQTPDQLKYWAEQLTSHQHRINTTISEGKLPNRIARVLNWPYTSVAELTMLHLVIDKMTAQIAAESYTQAQNNTEEPTTYYPVVTSYITIDNGDPTRDFYLITYGIVTNKTFTGTNSEAGAKYSTNQFHRAIRNNNHNGNPDTFNWGTNLTIDTLTRSQLQINYDTNGQPQSFIENFGLTRKNHADTLTRLRNEGFQPEISTNLEFSGCLTQENYDALRTKFDELGDDETVRTTFTTNP